MKYIDADKMIAEIENIRREFYYKGEQNLLHDAEIIRRSAISSCNDFLFLIESLQQEQPEVDLEKEMDKWFDLMGDAWENGEWSTNDIRSTAHHFYKLGRFNARKEE